MAHLTLAGAMSVCDHTVSWLARFHAWSVHSHKQQRQQKGAAMKLWFSSLSKGWWLAPEASADVSHSSSSSETKLFSVKQKQQWAFEIKSGVVNHPPQLRFCFLMPKLKRNNPPTRNILFVESTWYNFLLSISLLYFCSLRPVLFQTREQIPLNWQVPCLQRKLNLWSSITYTCVHTHTHRCTHATMKCQWIKLFTFCSYLLHVRQNYWSFFECFLYTRKVFTKPFLWDIGSFWQCRFRSVKWLAMCVFISRLLQRSAPLPYAD